MTDVDKSVDKVYSLFLPLSRSSDTMQNERERHADDKGPDMNSKKAPVRTGKKAPVRTGRPAPAAPAAPAPAPAPAPAAPTTKTGKVKRTKKIKGANFASETIWSSDNINVLRGMNSECVDLIYLDPPFNSNRNYEAPIGSRAAGASFKDAWTLDDIDVCEHGELADRNPAAYSVIDAARHANGKSMQSYLIFMAVRLLEMHRVLKPTGSIYLHCDPTAGHYLKLLMDGIFGRENFRNEVIWHYDGPQRPSPKKFGSKHDTILRYSKTDDYYANEKGVAPFQSYSAEELKKYKKLPSGRYYYTTPKGDYTDKSVARLEKEGRIERTKTGNVRVRHFLKIDRSGGIGRNKQLHDVWSDITSLGHAGGNEKVGYPTQKPLALLERIVKASSDEGDIVLDPFCGCATTLVVADRLQRKWVGIDLSPLAIKLVNDRIKEDRRIWGGATALKEPPRRTDLGKLPNYRTHRHELYGKQEGVCAGCDTHFPFRVMEVDHMLPRSKGGTDHIENLQILCSGCNRSKGGRTMAEWKADK